MSSMYEKIMGLTLFKGISREAVSIILEKTPVHFTNYHPGEIIGKEDDVCTSIRCIISGEVEIERDFPALGATLRETIGEGEVVGATRLFGLHNQLGIKIRAKGKVSILEISKSHYLYHLQRNQILLLNLLNYLSRAVQKLETFHSLEHPASEEDDFKKRIRNYISSGANNWEIEADPTFYEKYRIPFIFYSHRPGSKGKIIVTSSR